jgi:hypothetical protein
MLWPLLVNVTLPVGTGAPPPGPATVAMSVTCWLTALGLGLLVNATLAGRT